MNQENLLGMTKPHINLLHGLRTHVHMQASVSFTNVPDMSTDRLMSCKQNETGVQRKEIINILSMHIGTV